MQSKAIAAMDNRGYRWKIEYDRAGIRKGETWKMARRKPI
jgi:hypothetical protein